MGAHFSRSLREVGFLTGGTPRDVGAPSLRFLQEPALSLPKGRVRCCRYHCVPRIAPFLEMSGGWPAVF